MENKYDRISQIAYCCFYAGIVIEALLVLIDKSAYINPIEGQMFRLTFLLFMLKVCLTRYTGYEYLWGGFLILLLVEMRLSDW